MPRRRRVHMDGIPLHIVQRGHNREPCFFDEDDYRSYLYWLGKALAETECELHAYVLMTNHVHLLLTPKKAHRVPELIISIGRRYVQYINRIPAGALACCGTVATNRAACRPITTCSPACAISNSIPCAQQGLKIPRTISGETKRRSPAG